jgi:hypothetical protein
MRVSRWSGESVGMNAAWVSLALALCLGCRSAPKPGGSEPAPTPSPAPPAAQAPHSEADCDGDHSGHPSLPRPPAPVATALTAPQRAQLTTLRISAHVGSVIIRKVGDAWTVAGPQGCTVPAARMERALDNLSGLRAVQTDERPRGGAFELQIVALMGEERALLFDIAQRKDGWDLLQLGNASTFRLEGLNRKLLAADPLVWCAPGE